METKTDLSTLVVLESSSCLMAELDSDTAMTLIALMSEDPSSWSEAMSVWPRYRTPAVCEFASSLPLEEMQRETATAALLAATAWVVIDFESKRVLTGGQFEEVGRDAAFAMVEGERGKPRWPLSIHLPPWWELHESVLVDDVNQPRQAPINKPNVNRDVLYGDAFLAEIAARILQTIESTGWQSRVVGKGARAYYSFTVAVHRDWLMTTREDLGGRTPRNLLHGAIEWSDRVTEGQRRRFDDGGPMVAAPNDWNGFATAPMGSQEMCIYFDLCREVIQAGWEWTESEAGKSALQERESALPGLIQFLREVRDAWLGSPLEGGPPPSFIIECDRRRVPRGVGVEIEGIDGVQSDEHITDCDCPICQMMADGMFGVTFTSIDGHHLELDDEFAFSMCQTREAWEEQRLTFGEFDVAPDDEQAEEAASETDDAFSSAWTGVSDEPIPGDRGGVLKMAFMIGEIVSDLQQVGADLAEIKALNAAFADYRRAEEDQRSQAAVRLQEILQSLGNQYPDLVSKSADLQGHIDEIARTAPLDDHELGFPY